MFKAITIPQFGSSYGNDLNNALTNIDYNFKLIQNSDFLKGDRGESVFIKTIDVSSNKEILQMLKDGVTEQFGLNKPSNINNISVLDQFDVDNGANPGYISLIYENDELISSLPYIFKDKRFENTENESLFENETDWSGVLYYDSEKGKFVAIQEFPTLYYENGFKWKINGVKTGLDAKGPKGDKGENSSLFTVKVELAEEGRYRITHILVGYDGSSDVIDLSTYNSSAKEVCKQFGIIPKSSSHGGTIVIAIYESMGENETYIGPVYSLQDDMYVECGDNLVFSAASITSKEVEEICLDLWDIEK